MSDVFSCENVVGVYSSLKLNAVHASSIINYIGHSNLLVPVFKTILRACLITVFNKSIFHIFD